ncbi:hypothetical protein [Lewinella sp. IMCC34191]|uniref:hypothetical protein n=1 Tax=Lewinella sp. IMCC34191 TaxID=2259172 RepID=UPI000E263B28|nr:hypothetical protein [Lewinella sp. IMCC34191]
MKHILAIILIAFVNQSAMTQSNLHTPLDSLPRAFREDGLLSPAGEANLREAISSDEMSILYQRGATLRSLSEDDYAAQIFAYLASAYSAAHYNRRGIPVITEVMIQFDLSSWPPPENHPRGQEMRDTVTARMRQVPGFIEERDRLREADRSQVKFQVLDARTEVFYPPISAPATGPMNLVPSDRSVSGLDCRATLNSLRKHGLIDEGTYERYRADIARNGLLPDHLLLQRIAMEEGQQIYLREQARQRSQAVKSLTENGILSAQIADQLLLDTAFLQSDERADFYPILGPAFRLRVGEPRTAQQLADAVREDLCKLDPAFCEVEVVLDQYNPATDTVKIYDTSPLLQTILRPFNAYLDRLNAAYRLYFGVASPGGQTEESWDLYLFQFTSPELRLLASPAVSSQLPSIDSAGARFLSPADVADIVSRLEELGLTAQLSSNEIARAEECIRSGTVHGIVELLRCYPGISRPQTSEDLETPKSLNRNILADATGTLYINYRAGRKPESYYLRLPVAVAEYIERLYPYALFSLD